MQPKSFSDGFPLPGGPWPAIRRDLDRPNRRPVVAVIGYIGKDAPTVMPLRKGDILVCDASETAVKGRLTNVAALQTFRKRGVNLFSLSGLHAKVIASPTAAWVGSSNASNNSETRLIEAAVKVTKRQARQVHQWACSLATEDCHLSSTDLKRLSELKLLPPRKGPGRIIVPRELPETVGRLVFWRVGGEISEPQMRAIERDRPEARRDAERAGLPSVLEPISFTGDTVVKAGDWLITRSRGRVQSPDYVVRVASKGRYSTLWVFRVRVSRRPSLALLRTLAPKLDQDPIELEIRKPTVTTAILDLFR